MAENQEMREGAASVRIALLLLLVVGIGLFFVLQGVIEQLVFEITAVAERYPDVAIRMGNRLLLWLVVLSGAVSAVIGTYLQLVSLRIVRERQSPPSNLPVAFRTQILRGDAALKVARSYRWVALVLWLQPLAGVLLWFWISGANI